MVGGEGWDNSRWDNLPYRATSDHVPNFRNVIGRSMAVFSPEHEKRICFLDWVSCRRPFVENVTRHE